MLRTSQIVSSLFLFAPQPSDFFSQIFIRIWPILYDADILKNRFSAVKIYVDVFNGGAQNNNLCITKGK
jgi:hypothetical protein